MQARLNGGDLDPVQLGVNDGLNFGRFDALGQSLVHDYELRLLRAELSAEVESLWNELVVESRVDDLREAEPSALARMNYPTLAEAFAFPEALREVLEVFLCVEILKVYVPFSSRSKFVVNSVETIVVEPDGLVFSGRCFERALPVA